MAAPPSPELRPLRFLLPTLRQRGRDRRGQSAVATVAPDWPIGSRGELTLMACSSLALIVDPIC